MLDVLIDKMEKEVDAQIYLKPLDLSKNLYIFGTKRVTATEKNNKLMIRVGGGYMEYKAFYEQYSEIESNRVERARSR